MLFNHKKCGEKCAILDEYLNICCDKSMYVIKAMTEHNYGEMANRANMPIFLWKIEKGKVWALAFKICDQLSTESLIEPMIFKPKLMQQILWF